MARPDDMTLVKVYPELTPDQESLLRELLVEHPNDIRALFDKGSATIKTRQEHWLGYVDYLLQKVNRVQVKTKELVTANDSVRKEGPSLG